MVDVSVLISIHELNIALPTGTNVSFFSRYLKFNLIQRNILDLLGHIYILLPS